MAEQEPKNLKGAVKVKFWTLPSPPVKTSPRLIFLSTSKNRIKALVKTIISDPLAFWYK